MAFNTKEQEIIKYGKANGKSRQEVEQAITNYRTGIVKTPTPTQTQETGFISEVGKSFSERGKKVSESISASESKGTVGGALQSGFNIAGQFAGGALDIIGAGVNALAPEVVKKTVSTFSNKVADLAIQNPTILEGLNAVNEGVDKYQIWKATNPEDAKTLEGAVNIALLLSGSGAESKAMKSTAETTGKLAVGVEDSALQALKVASDVKQKLIKFVAPEADDMTKTILKESQPADIDKFVKLQEVASKDPRAITPYEYIGDQMSNATKILQKELENTGKLKSEFVGGTRGLESFESKTLLNNLNSLKNSKTLLEKGDISTIDKIISQAKNIKTVGSADKFIDDIQGMIYKGNKDMTIPVGSTLDKQLRGIIGTVNRELKSVLPKEYSTLNARYSNLLKTTNTLNNALGEVVEGISTRGGSLVKQFFSPNGRKAKELFGYIKVNTGIDLAKDATLARYIMELYGDPRVRTLLGGEIPTSVSGIMNKIVDFAVEKTGLGKGIQEAQRTGAIKKAKTLTQPK